MKEYTLDYCVNMVLADIGETSTRYKQQYLNYAIAGFRRLNLAGMMPTTKTVLLDIDQNTNTAILPDDYVDYLKVGLCVGCQGKGIGGFVNLTYNPNICDNLQADFINSGCECTQDSLITDIANVSCGCTDGMNAWGYYPYWYNGGWYDGAYGYGSGQYRGGYNIFPEQNKIAFDSFITGEKVLLEYMSNGMAGAGTLVPEGAVGCITTWIHYQRSLHSADRTTRLDIVPYKQAFNAEYTGFRARHASMTLWDWKETYLQSFSQSVKR